MRISLYWSSGVESAVLEHLRERLAATFSCEVEPGEEFELLGREYAPARDQYSSTRVLGRLSTLNRPGELLLAITDEDLFAGGLNFVFGEADTLGRCAIISLIRLAAEYPGEPLTEERFLNRALIEAVHEVGHLLGLGHCPKEACVMHFSNSLYDTDCKSAGFCRRCRGFLE